MWKRANMMNDILLVEIGYRLRPDLLTTTGMHRFKRYLAHTLLFRHELNHGPNHLTAEIDLRYDNVSLKHIVRREPSGCPFVRCSHEAIVSQHIAVVINAQA